MGAEEPDDEDDEEPAPAPAALEPELEPELEPLPDPAPLPEPEPEPVLLPLPPPLPAPPVGITTPSVAAQPQGSVSVTGPGVAQAWHQPVVTVKPGGMRPGELVGQWPSQTSVMVCVTGSRALGVLVVQSERYVVVYTVVVRGPWH